jgi:hypothetical protein
MAEGTPPSFPTRSCTGRMRCTLHWHVNRSDITQGWVASKLTFSIS